MRCCTPTCEKEGVTRGTFRLPRGRGNFLGQGTARHTHNSPGQDVEIVQCDDCWSKGRFCVGCSRYEHTPTWYMPPEGLYPVPFCSNCAKNGFRYYRIGGGEIVDTPEDGYDGRKEHGIEHYLAS